MSKYDQTIPSKTDFEIVEEILDKAIEIVPKYTQDKIDNILRDFHKNQKKPGFVPTEEVKWQMSDIFFLQNVRVYLPNHLSFRCIVMFTDSVIDKSIHAAGLLWDDIPYDVSRFWACQLWRLDKSKHSDVQGLLYLEMKLKSFVPHKKFNIKVCNCGACAEYEYPEILISTKNLKNFVCGAEIYPEVLPEPVTKVEADSVIFETELNLDDFLNRLMPEHLSGNGRKFND